MVQPGCILGGPRFRSTRAVLLLVRCSKFEWYYRKIGKPYFAEETAEKQLDLKSLKGRKKAEELRTRQNSGTEGPPEVGGPSLKKIDVGLVAACAAAAGACTPLARSRGG